MRKRVIKRIKRPLTAIAAILLNMTAFCVILPTDVQAIDTSYWVTVLPSGSNSSYWWSYGRYYSGEGPLPQAQIANDSSTFDLYTTLPSVAQVVEVSDYTDNISWVWVDIADHINIGDRTIASFLPPEGADIDAVLVATRFGVVLPASGTVYFPSFKFYYSLDGDVFEWSDLYSASTSTNPYKVWNITSFESWTSESFNTTELTARMVITPQQYVHYYLDYVGFVIYWSGEFVGGGAEGGGPTQVPPTDYDRLLTAEGIPTIMGIVGFFGMMAAGPIGIYVAQNSGQSRIAIFVKTLCMWVIFLTFFLVAVI